MEFDNIQAKLVKYMDVKIFAWTDKIILPIFKNCETQQIVESNGGQDGFILIDITNM